MKKTKEYTEFFTFDDRFDVTLIYEDSRITDFALNYRGYLEGRWHQVYRVDTAHGYLHAQKFWINNKPIPIKGFEAYEIEVIVRYFIERVKENWPNYKRLYIEKLRRR